MRLFGHYDDLGLPTWGVLLPEGVITADELRERGGLAEGLSLVDPGFLLGAEPEIRGRLEEAVDRALAAGAAPVPAETLAPAPVIPDPGKIVCVGLNFRDHVLEQRLAMPDRPILFAKFSNTVIGDGEPVVRPEGTHALDLEVELGVVIGRRARRVPAGAALEHVAGYLVLNDITARDWQGNPQALRPGERGDGQWLRAKGSDTFCPRGAVLVTADEIADPQALRLRSWRVPGNGPEAGREILMQDGTTADMIWPVAELIAYISAVITLEPGDIIATGTPAGVGVFRDPPVFLEPGDRVRAAVEGIGEVANPIIDWTEAERLEERAEVPIREE